MQIRFRLPTSIAAVAAAIGLAACGGSSTLDTSKLKSDVVAQIAAHGFELRDVHCQEVDAEVDAPVRCTAMTAEDTKIFVEGKVTKVEGDQGAYELVVARTEAKGTAVAAEVKAMLEAEAGAEAEAMTCPDIVHVPTKGPVRCTLTVPGGDRYGVSVSVNDKGDATAEMDPEPIS